MAEISSMADRSENDLKELGVFNTEAEQQILGALLVNNPIYEKISGTLEKDHFYDPLHARIFQAIKDRIDLGQIASPVTLRPQFQNDEGLKDLGGLAYLVRLAGSSIASFAVPDYAAMVVDLSAKRAILTQFSEARERIKAGEAAAPIASSIETAAGALLSSTTIKPMTRTHLSSLLTTVSKINDAYQGVEASGLSTGIPQLDEALSYMRGGQFIVLGGRPAMGKTTAAQNMAYHAATNGVGVFFGSLEMPVDDLTTRFISRGLAEKKIRIPYSNTIKGRLSEQNMRDVVDEAKRQEALPLVTAERDVRDISRFRSAVKRTHQFMADSACPLGLVVVDYVQLLQSTKARSPYERASEASDAMKSLALELDVPVVALAQLSRGVEQREDKHPMLSDLRETGKLEEDADVVMFCYREAYYLQKQMENLNGKDIEKEADMRAEMERRYNDLDFIIAKQRSGAEKTVKAFVDLATCHVYADRSHEAEALI